MCGRYGHTNQDKEKIKKRFRLKKIDLDLKSRYNITPGQDVPVILNESPQELSLARWGLVPFWAKEDKIGYRMINARAETIFEKPSYRNSIKKKRCLIPADHFFEWQKTDQGKKPHCIKMKSNEPFAFAGIWDCWREELISCSTITTTPNSLLKKVHDRMPVILSKEDEEIWLSAKDPEDIKKLLMPHKTSGMEAFEVSSLVNSPSNNTKDVLDPV